MLDRRGTDPAMAGGAGAHLTRTMILYGALPVRPILTQADAERSLAMGNSFTIGKIAGIRIEIHYTWLLIFGLVTWSLAQGFFPANFPGWTTIVYWMVGFLSAIALFVSVLAHELSHSFMARARGVDVDSITLFIFGGVSNLKTESEEPRDEFLISIVGPLTSFVLAGGFLLARLAVAQDETPLGASLGYLALVNFMLGAFNLLPGFPLDGGRVLRSVIWSATNNLRTATNVASVIGQVIGFLMIIWGVSQAFSGSVFDGIWIAFIGWFLNGAAEATRQQQVVREHLGNVKVSALMRRDTPMVPLSMSVHEFVFDHVLQRGERAALLADGHLLGIASIKDAKKVPQDRWSITPLRNIMTPAPLKTVGPEDNLTSALDRLSDGEFNQLPVLQDGRVVGLLNRSDVLRYIRLRDELGVQNEGGAQTANSK